MQTARALRANRRNARKMQNEQYTETSVTNRQGDQYITFSWTIEPAVNTTLRDLETGKFVVITELSRILGFRTIHSHHRVSVGLRRMNLNNDFDEWSAPVMISTQFKKTAHQALQVLKVQLENLEMDYSDMLHVTNTLDLRIMIPNQENAAAGQRFRTKANHDWLIPGEYTTTTNCFYSAFQMAKNPLEFATAYEEWLNDETLPFPNFVEQAKDLKKRTKQRLKKHDQRLTESFTDLDLARDIVQHCKPQVVMKIYDGQFKLIETIEPVAKSVNTAKKQKLSLNVVQLQRAQNHYRPLIPWDELPDQQILSIQEAIVSKGKKSKEQKMATRIVKHFKGEKTRNRRMVSWDSEESTTADGAFKAYAVGMAWYKDEYADDESVKNSCESYWDGDQEMLYMSFWGTDCMLQMIQFLDSNQVYFDDSYFYAHNGGKFDLPILLKEALFDYKGALIQGKKCTIVNGRWIAFDVLMLGNEATFHFRDSLALLAGSLAKLTKDYKVPHQKLTETVDHDMITLENWGTFSELPQYLVHDCLGLLELLDRFGAEVFEITYTEKYELNQSECRTANIIEALTGLPHLSLVKTRPSWLTTPHEKGLKGRRLELDGYSEEHKLAFEFQGQQHYDNTHFFHKSPESFDRLQHDDLCKVEKCKERHVKLLVVDQVNVDHIKTQLSKLGIPLHAQTVTKDRVDQPRLRDCGGISITRTPTASSLAKKMFYNVEYNEAKFPLFHLTKDQDKYIRDESYFGGRVELFQFGVIKGNVYYLDFTSLYPAMGYVHLLPFGAPTFWTNFEIPSGDEDIGFGLYKGMNRAKVYEMDNKYCEWVLKLHAPSPEMCLFTRFLRGTHRYKPAIMESCLPIEFFGWVTGYVRSTPEGLKRMPLHGVKNADSLELPASSRGKLMFPHLNAWKLLTLFSEEIRLGETLGLYEYQPRDGLSFKSGPILKKTFGSLFKVKAQAKANGCPAKEKAIKIMANSSYGFWGQNTTDRETVKIYESGDVPIYDYLARDALVEEADHGRYTCLRVVEDLDLKDFNVGVAAAITSYGRMRIWKLMDTLQTSGYKIYQCDTDSIMTDADLSKESLRNVREEFIPDWYTDSPGAELGSLKCECTDEVEKVIKKNIVLNPSPVDLDENVRKKVATAIRMAKERDSISWKPLPFCHPEGTLCNSASKTYYLRTLTSAGPVDIAKAKGMAKYDKNGESLYEWSDFEAMHKPAAQCTLELKDGKVSLNLCVAPKPLRCKMPQFKSGISQVYMRDGGLNSVILHEIPKAAFARYDKGVLQSDGTILPFAI